MKCTISYEYVRIPSMSWVDGLSLSKPGVDVLGPSMSGVDIEGHAMSGITDVGDVIGRNHSASGSAKISHVCTMSLACRINGSMLSI